MKVICLIRPEAPLIYFVNKINEQHKVSLVILEISSVKKRLIAKIKSYGIIGVIDALRNRILNKTKQKQYASDYNKHFHDKWKQIDSDIPILKVKDINSQTVYGRLKAESPDLMLDHGTSLVKDNIAKTSNLALNLHWGLSPYYRGAHCTEWALTNWDPYNIGVTIHKLTKIIDGGSIWAQKRAIIKPGDTINSINMQLTQLGAELVIKAIDKIESGQQLQFEKQDYSLGFLAVNRQWTKCLGKQSEYIERNNLIEVMLKKPARKQKLPIVEQ